MFDSVQILFLYPACFKEEYRDKYSSGSEATGQGYLTGRPIPTIANACLCYIHI